MSIEQKLLIWKSLEQITLDTYLSNIFRKNIVILSISIYRKKGCLKVSLEQITSNKKSLWHIHHINVISISLFKANIIRLNGINTKILKTSFITNKIRANFL
jgi:hypothetical protein